MNAHDHLLELEQLIKDAKRVPLTDQVRIDPDKAMALIERIRESLIAQN